MKTLLPLLLVFLVSSANAETYYFSTASGNDSRNQKQATNPATPWKTINKLNAVFGSLKPGDAILFKRGETFYGSINVNKSGRSGSPIYIGAYGSGDKPVISSLVTLSGWKKNSSYKGVYDCDASEALGDEVNIVLLNDMQKTIGRYPNSDAANKGYLTIDSHNGTKSITDKQLPSSPNWTGAEAVVRSSHWIINRSKIKSQSGKTINFADAVFARDDYGYFIQNSIKALDQLGEWYYNPSTRKLSMYFGSKSPSSYNVKASAINSLIYSNRVKYVVFDNLTLKGADKYGFDINNGGYIQIKNCDVLFSGIDGVRISYNPYSSVENCNVSYSNNNGIAAADGSSRNTVIRNNVVKYTSTIAGMGQSGDGQGAGISINRDGLAEYNEIINSGYVGIQIQGNDVVVKNNYIDNFCFVKDDGGGIYTHNGAKLTNTGRKLIGNIILNGIGAGAGTNTSNSSAQGIYVDDNVNGIEMTGNTIANCNRGIYLHNSRDITVRGNTFYNNDDAQLFVAKDGFGGPLKNHVITRNILFSKYAGQKVLSISTINDDKGIKSLGRLDSNYYARPIENKAIIFNSTYLYTKKEFRVNRDLKGWQEKFGEDMHSKISAKLIASYSIKNVKGDNKVGYGSFNSRSDVKGWANSCTMSWDNSGTLDGGCLKTAPKAKGSSIVLNVGSLSKGKEYVLRYSLKATAPMSITTYIRSSNYKPVSASRVSIATKDRSENEMIFTSSKDVANGSVVFAADAQNTYYLDNIRLLEAQAVVTNPDDSIRFVTNPTRSNKTISLKGKFVDVKNNKYSNSITLSPYTSAVLISDEGTSSSKENKAPDVRITSPGSGDNFAAHSAIKINVNASDADGTVSKVDIYNGKTLLYSTNKSPYNFTWTNVSAGNYTLTAKATDNDNAVTTSAETKITVYNPTAKKAPIVSITTPDENQSYQGPATINITAKATDADGKISKVEFYNGTKLLHTEYNGTYTCTWKNVPAGNYILTAKATDNDGFSTTSAKVKVSVTNKANKRPTITITNPVNKTNYTGPATVRLIADAKDADGKISRVEFYNGSKLIRTEYYYPYTYWWRKVPVGDYTVTAIAVDDKGVSTRSAEVKIKVKAKGKKRDVSSNSIDAANQETTALNSADTVETIEKADAQDELVSMKLSPNPVSNVLNISTSGLQTTQPLSISVLSITGVLYKTIQSNNANQVARVDVSSLQKGTYIIRIVCGDKILNKQFIKL